MNVASGTLQPEPGGGLKMSHSLDSPPSGLAVEAFFPLLPGAGLARGEEAGLSTNPLDSSEAPGPGKAWQDHECACHSWDGRTAPWAMGHPVRGLHSSHAPPAPPRAWVTG